MSSALLSVCVIARNESHCIATMLASVQAVAQEIILVDTGSQDSTPEIAKAFGAHVYDYEWQNDFSKVRNYSLEQATGDYILVLDADEQLDEDSVQYVSSLLTESACAYYLRRHHYWANSTNIFTQPLSQESHFYARGARAYHVTNDIRLFPRDSRVRFTGVVHETVEDAIRSACIPVQESEIIIHHTGPLASSEEQQRKAQFYYELTQAKVDENPDDWRNWFQMGVEAIAVGEFTQSIGALAKAVELEDRVADVWSQLGQAHVALGNFEDAVMPLQRALGLNDRCAISWNALGVVFQKLGRQSEAKLCFETALGILPHLEVAKQNMQAIE